MFYEKCPNCGGNRAPKRTAWLVSTKLSRSSCTDIAMYVGRCERRTESSRLGGKGGSVPSNCLLVLNLELAAGSITTKPNGTNELAPGRLCSEKLDSQISSRPSQPVLHVQPPTKNLCDVDDMREMKLVQKGFCKRRENLATLLDSCRF